jgi:hypothetical protein
MRERTAVTVPQDQEEFVLEFRGVRTLLREDSTVEVLIQSSRGDIRALLHPSPGQTGAVLFGNLRGPAGGLYGRLSPELVRRGINAMRLEFRQRGDLAECVGDTLGGLSFLKAIGIDRVATVGASFGGAVAIRAGIISPLVTAVAALASQTYGAQDVHALAPKHLLVVHGLADRVLGPHNGQNIYEWAGEPKELVLYPDTDHDLLACREALHAKLLEWLPARVGPESSA